MAVIFVCFVSLGNAAFPVPLSITRAERMPVGGPSPDSPLDNAFIGTDSVFPVDAPVHTEDVMHDALAGSSGQSAYAEIPESARDFVRRFSLPARGINWGILHLHNAVDVAGACGSGVYAVSAGQVADVRNGWDGGYGNYVDIDHGNGVITRYAHAETVLVTVGQMVAHGDMVAHMGSTGNSTGCHVHFEVLGPAAAVNPFATN